MSETEVFDFLGKYDEGLFMNYGVYSDGETVKVYELSAGGNGKISDLTVSEFFCGYDDGITIREIGNNDLIKQFENSVGRSM